MLYGMHTYKAKEWKNCQQTALINHASINHFLLPVSPSPPLTHQTQGKSAFMAQFLFWTAAHKPPPCPLPSFCLSLPLPLLSCQHRRQSGLSWLQSPLCITYTRWYNFCNVVKQLQGRSCSLARSKLPSALCFLNKRFKTVLKALLLSKVISQGIIGTAIHYMAHTVHWSVNDSHKYTDDYRSYTKWVSMDTQILRIWLIIAK